MLQTISVKVYGKVQGVFFRQSTKEKANALGLTGWVKNQPDGSVHIIVSGQTELLDKFAAWCKQGPPRAQVENILIETLDTVQFDRFSIKYV
ncbi:MAG TPA: acylphosphatase [Chitinophagaceae bacterium]|nr:acylphosphatase [Chitinophagaceae bacterium]